MLFRSRQTEIEGESESDKREGGGRKGKTSSKAPCRTLFRDHRITSISVKICMFVCLCVSGLCHMLPQWSQDTAESQG